MEILWYCRQLVKGGAKHTCGKFCNINVEAGEEYTAYTLEYLTLLYQVQLRLFAIAGLSISRTVTFGKLAEKVVIEKNWSCYHPAYYARKFPSGLLEIFTATQPLSTTGCSSMGDRKSNEFNLSNRQYLMDILNSFVKRYLIAFCFGNETAGLIFLKEHSSYQHVCFFVDSWYELQESELPIAPLVNTINPKFPKVELFTSILKDTDIDIQAVLVKPATMAKSRIKNKSFNQTNFEIDWKSYKADHFQVFIKVKLWLFCMGSFAQRIRKNISSLQKKQLGNTLVYLKELHGWHGFKVGSMLYQLPGIKNQFKSDTRRVVEIVFVYKTEEKSTLFKFLWKKSRTPGCFQPKSSVKAAVLEFGLGLGVYLVDGTSNCVGFTNSSMLKEFINNNHSNIAWKDTIHEKTHESLVPLEMRLENAAIKWSNSYTDYLTLHPFTPTNKYIASTLNSTKMFKNQSCCNLAYFEKFGLDLQTIRNLDYAVVPTKWKAKLLVSSLQLKDGFWYSSVLDTNFKIDDCSCFVESTVFQIKFVNSQITLSRVFNFGNPTSESATCGLNNCLFKNAFKPLEITTTNRYSELANQDNLHPLDTERLLELEKHLKLADELEYDYSRFDTIRAGLHCTLEAKQIQIVHEEFNLDDKFESICKIESILRFLIVCVIFARTLASSAYSNLSSYDNHEHTIAVTLTKTKGKNLGFQFKFPGFINTDSNDLEKFLYMYCSGPNFEVKDDLDAFNASFSKTKDTMVHLWNQFVGCIQNSLATQSNLEKKRQLQDLAKFILSNGTAKKAKLELLVLTL